MSIENVAITYSVLRRDVGESRILSINRIDELIARTLRRYIRQTQTYIVVSVIVMRTDEESRRTSVASFSVQTLTVSGPMLIKLSLYSFRSIL